MIITYRHEDGADEVVDTDDLGAVEAAAIESCTGMEWGEVDDALRRQSPTAMRAVLWVFRKRSAPTLRFSEFDVPKWQRRLKARLNYDEVLEFVEALRRDCKTDEEFDGMLRHVRALANDEADVHKAIDETAAPKEAVAEPVAPEESAG
jgi:hypothetical protein